MNNINVEDFIFGIQDGSVRTGEQLVLTALLATVNWTQVPKMLWISVMVKLTQ